MLHISDGFQSDWSTLYRKEIAPLSAVGAHFLGKAKQMFYIVYICYSGEIEHYSFTCVFSALFEENSDNYSKTCLKRPLKNRQNKGLEDKW